MSATMVGTDNNLISNSKQRESLKREISRRLQAIEGLVWNRLSVDADAYISVEIDYKEKHDAFGELGYYRTVSSFFYKYSTLEEVLEVFMDWVNSTLEDEKNRWEQAMAHFNEQFKDTPAEQIPTRRSKAYVLQEIYQEKLRISY